MTSSKTIRLPLSIYTPDIDNTHANASAQNRDPFKFSHGLTGVDQQANFRLVHIILVTTMLLITFVACLRWSANIRANRRRQAIVTSRRNSKSRSGSGFALWRSFKRYFLYPPTSLKSRRNTRDMSLRRPETTVACIYVLSNFACCLAIPYQAGGAQRFAAFRGRCGTFAMFNLILTMLFALRNNPLIWLLRVGYDTFNFFHRWTARLVLVQSLAHVFAFGINAYHVTYAGQSGWQSIRWVLQHSLSYQWGLAAIITFILMTALSISPVRHAFYDTFLSLHRLGAVIGMAGVYFHIGKHALPQLPWVYLAIGLFASEYLIRILRILRVNFGWKEKVWTRVIIEALPAEATRVTFALPQAWRANPGSHVHIYLPRIALWSSHPFSVAWIESSGYARLAQEKLPLSVEDLKMERGPSAVSCIVRARNGMTRSLYKLATSGKADSVCLWGAVEGPYGGYHSLESYEVVVLFEAGVGVTHQLLLVQHLLAGYTNGTVAARKILLVWCVTMIDAMDWVSPWLEDILAMPAFQEVVSLRLHVSKMTPIDLARQPLLLHLDLRTGRCDVNEVVDQEVVAQASTVAVSVCGPPSFSSDVRAAVSRRVCDRHIDLFDESFSY